MGVDGGESVTTAVEPEPGVVVVVVIVVGGELVGVVTATDGELAGGADDEIDVSPAPESEAIVVGSSGANDPFTICDEMSGGVLFEIVSVSVEPGCEPEVEVEPVVGVAAGGSSRAD